MEINRRSSGAIIRALHWVIHAGCSYMILRGRLRFGNSISGHALHADGMTLYLNEMEIDSLALRHFTNWIKLNFKRDLIFWKPQQKPLEIGLLVAGGAKNVECWFKQIGIPLMCASHFQYEKTITRIRRDWKEANIYIFVSFYQFHNRVQFFYRGRRHTLLLLGIMITDNDNIDASPCTKDKHSIILIKRNSRSFYFLLPALLFRHVLLFHCHRGIEYRDITYHYYTIRHIFHIATRFW